MKLGRRWLPSHTFLSLKQGFHFETSRSQTFLPSFRIPHPHIPLLPLFHHTQAIGAATANMTTHILGADFRAFLEGCSEEQAAQITDVLKQVTSRAALSPAPGTTTARSAVVKPDKKSVKKAKQSKLAVATGGPKRPLNSWMAYRSKCAAIQTKSDY